MYTSLEPFIGKFCNFSNDICEKGINYDYIGSLSYDKKKELIDFENDVKIARSTVYYHESVYSTSFLKRQEEILEELLEKKWNRAFRILSLR